MNQYLSIIVILAPGFLMCLGSEKKNFATRTVNHYYDIIQPRETNSCDERGTPGLICQSCDLLATCIKVNGQWIIVPVEPCDESKGSYCNLHERGCSNATGPCHPFGFEGNFACTSQGVFPDPYDCQKYHMCYQAGSTLVAANIECGADKAFSVSTGACSHSLLHSSCQGKQYVCENSGDIRAWPDSNNIFYICKAITGDGDRILYPTLYRCASGEIFVGQECVAEGSVQLGTGSPGVSNTVSSPTDFYCKEVGLNDVPNDCYSYYYCSTDGSYVKYTCPQRTYFNKATRSCVLGRC